MKFKIQNLKFRISTIGYLLSIVGLFFYSFTQIDLSLTLSQLSIWQVFEKFFQHIGYFQRPLSSLLFIGIVGPLFIFYLFILSAVHKRKISKETVWFLIISTILLLTFSYNAFSYDLFNYIFDAKIVTYYNLNPYTHRALDFPGDPMLSFMHWTHRFLPYGPTWLILTVPLSFVGLQFFLPTFFLFKILMSLSFLGTVFFIGKILRKISQEFEVFGIGFFALNPLVVIESLVSSHNDIVMMFFTILSLYLLISKKYLFAIVLLALSVGIKFASLFLLPIFLLVYFFEKNNKQLNWGVIFSTMTIIMIIPIILASYRTNFQPWYLLNILPLASLVARKYYFFIPSVVISFVSIFHYPPFLYLGSWEKPVPSILFWMTTSSIFISVFLVAIWFLRQRGIK